MSNLSWLCIGLAVVVVLGLYRWYSYWSYHARKFSQSGYMAPKTTWAGKVFMNLSTRLLTFLTVGPVKVVNGHKSPKSGRTVYIGNHQMPCDFAMLRRGAGRHFRTLTSAKELKGFFGVLGAWSGVISIAFKEKADRAAAQDSCVLTVTEENGCLGIFPEGNLLPDNPELNERWLPGAVRIARAASANAGGAPVNIVPIALYYEQDPQKASWSQRFLKRNKWLGKRDPRNWDPVFKLDLEKMGADEKARVEKERAEKLKEYYRSHVTLYGGVVVVGDPIEVSTLPSNEDEASSVLRDKVRELLAEAKKHS